MALLVFQINAVVEWLAEVTELTKDTALIVLTGFTKLSVPEFVITFELMINTERIIQFENCRDRHDDKK